MRSTLIGILFLAACLAAGCSKKEDTVSRIEGSEPQRLSFGRPEEVQQAFTTQMQACWFKGENALLADYEFDTKSALFDTASGPSELRQVTIRSEDDNDGRQFVVQFFPFNNNTLISTRNYALPLELAARMKRDIETWIFGRTDCGTLSLSSENAFPPQQPQISASGIQQPGSQGTPPNQQRTPGNSSLY